MNGTLLESLGGAGVFGYGLVTLWDRLMQATPVPLDEVDKVAIAGMLAVTVKFVIDRVDTYFGKDENNGQA